MVFQQVPSSEGFTYDPDAPVRRVSMKRKARRVRPKPVVLRDEQHYRETMGGIKRRRAERRLQEQQHRRERTRARIKSIVPVGVSRSFDRGGHDSRPAAPPSRRRTVTSRDDGDSGPGEPSSPARPASAPVAIAAAIKQRGASPYTFSFQRLWSEIERFGLSRDSRISGRRVDMEVLAALGPDFKLGAELTWEAENPGRYLPKSWAVVA